MKIAICGGGIAGLSFYLWLGKLGLLEQHEVIIYERRELATDHSMDDESSYSNAIVGGSLGIAPNGLCSVRRLDPALHDDIARTGSLNSKWRISNTLGWTLIEITTGISTVMIGRDDLWQCLRKRVPDGIISQKKVLDVRPYANGRPLMLCFADGSETSADLVIGADGIRSVVRRRMFSDDANEPTGKYKYEPHYEGLVGVACFVPGKLLSRISEGQTNIVNGRKGSIGYSFDRSSANPYGARGVCWSTYSLQDLPKDWRYIDAKDAERQIKARFASVQDVSLQDCLQQFSIDTVWPTFTVPPLPTWEDGKGCILLGDAAHAMQPSSGQGASMAFEDAEALAKLLKYHLSNDATRGHLVAGKQFYDFRKDRVTKIYRQGQKNGDRKREKSVVRELLAFVFFRLIAFLGIITRILRKTSEYDIGIEVDKFLRSQD